MHKSRGRYIDQSHVVWKFINLMVRKGDKGRALSIYYKIVKDYPEFINLLYEYRPFLVLETDRRKRGRQGNQYPKDTLAERKLKLPLIWFFKQVEKRHSKIKLGSVFKEVENQLKYKRENLNRFILLKKRLELHQNIFKNRMFVKYR